MTTRVVTTQAELDAALADGTLTEDDEILIQSPAGVWLTIGGEASAAEVNVAGESTVSVCGSARVGSVYGSARVGSVCGSARVGSVYGSASVGRVYDSARVGSATETSTVHLYDTSTLTQATPHVAVFLHSARATFAGGHLIDLTSLDLTDPATWSAHVGGKTTGDGRVVLYKAVDDQWRSPHGAVYTPGSETTCDDWCDDAVCGGGLHFSPSPAQAMEYHGQATRFVAVEVDVATLRPIPGGTAKCKAPSCRVLYEVDIHGRKVETAEATA